MDLLEVTFVGALSGAGLFPPALPVLALLLGPKLIYLVGVLSLSRSLLHEIV